MLHWKLACSTMLAPRAALRHGPRRFDIATLARTYGPVQVADVSKGQLTKDQRVALTVAQYLAIREALCGRPVPGKEEIEAEPATERTPPWFG